MGKPQAEGRRHSYARGKLKQTGFLCILKLAITSSRRRTCLSVSLGRRGSSKETAAADRQRQTDTFTEKDRGRLCRSGVLAYRLRPWGLEAVGWIGAHLAKQEAYEEASYYFNLASQLQPAERKWRLMAALCLRKSGQLAKALTLYEALHRENPEDENVLNGYCRTRSALGLQFE